jgi:hypothetical protein
LETLKEKQDKAKRAAEIEKELAETEALLDASRLARA